MEGAKRLKSLEVEEAVYPFLGPGRTADDVEQACAALEKVYHDKGLQTVSVMVPQQDPQRGIIRLGVVEGKVGRLRVNGARYYLPSRIKSEVPSLAEGNVPDMTRAGSEIVAVNRLADRRVTPALRTGVEPGTVDIDLNVEDKLPLHGSLELNNRYSTNTTPLRINGALSYANLFQLGHTLGGNFQIAPENPADAKVFSAYYLARVSDSWSLMLQGTKQNSDVSTLGGGAVGGRGDIVGIRALRDLPSGAKFYQNLSLGVDYMSVSDAETTTGATVLSHNGIAYPTTLSTTSALADAADVPLVTQGKYTFWCYLHMLDRGDCSGDAATVLTNLKSSLATSISSNRKTIKLADMQCERTTDGDIVNHY